MSDWWHFYHRHSISYFPISITFARNFTLLLKRQMLLYFKFDYLYLYEWYAGGINMFIQKQEAYEKIRAGISWLHIKINNINWNINNIHMACDINSEWEISIKIIASIQKILIRFMQNCVQNRALCLMHIQRTQFLALLQLIWPQAIFFSISWARFYELVSDQPHTDK